MVFFCHQLLAPGRSRLCCLRNYGTGLALALLARRVWSSRLAGDRRRYDVLDRATELLPGRSCWVAGRGAALVNETAGCGVASTCRCRTSLRL